MVAGMKRHSSPWKTGQQNCPSEVPVYLLTMPLTTVRMYLLVKAKGEQIYSSFSVLPAVF